MLPVVVAILIATWYFLFRYGRRRMYQLAKRIPGQRGIPFFGRLHNFIGDTEHILKVLIDISYEALKNGSITKIWLGHHLYFVITDPVDIEYVLKTCLEKDDLHKFFRVVIGNGLVFAPLKIWRTRRKIIVPTFHPKIVDTFVDVFSEQSEILAEQMKARVGTGTFDLWPHLSAFTLDTVCEIVLGTKIKAQTAPNPPFLQSINCLLNKTCERIFHVWLQSDFIFENLPSHKTYQKHMDIVYDFTNNIIRKKRDEIRKDESTHTVENKDCGPKDNKRKSFMDLLIESSSKSVPYSDLELREEVLALAVAGTDTSAVTMCFTLLLLGKHQDIQEKVYQELLDIYGNSDRPLVKEDLTKMVYLDRVIKESLRLYPPGPFIIRKVEKEITLPSGWVLPAGSGIPISIWGAQRNPKYWGEDAESFDPDRFSPERYNLAHPCAYIPFSSGPRNCLGYQYAMHFIKSSLSAVLRRYRVCVPEGTSERMIRVKIDIMMKAANGYEVALEERAVQKKFIDVA